MFQFTRVSFGIGFWVSCMVCFLIQWVERKAGSEELLPLPKIIVEKGAVLLLLCGFTVSP